MSMVTIFCVIQNPKPIMNPAAHSIGIPQLRVAGLKNCMMYGRLMR